MKILQVSTLQYVSLKLGGCICNSQRLGLLISFLRIVISATFLLSPNFFPGRVSINTLPWPWKNLGHQQPRKTTIATSCRMSPSDPYVQSDKRWGEKKFEMHQRFRPPKFTLWTSWPQEKSEMHRPQTTRVLHPGWTLRDTDTRCVRKIAGASESLVVWEPDFLKQVGLLLIAVQKNIPHHLKKNGSYHINPQLLEAFDEMLLFFLPPKRSKKKNCPKSVFSNSLTTGSW